MGRIRLFIVLALSLALVACATGPTTYRPLADGVGYSQFIGNDSTPRDRVEDYLLYRAAEVMRFGGHDRFILLEKIVEPETTYWGSGYTGPAFGLGVGSHHSFGSVAYGPSYYAPHTRFLGSALIRVYSPGQGGGPVFSAQALIEQIGPRIAWPQPGSSG